MTRKSLFLRNMVKSAVAVLVAVMFFASCEKPESAKQITAFGFDAPPAVGVINEQAKTIAVVVPAGTNVTALTPTITVSKGATVNPTSGAAQNFSTPVQYTVTAEDGSTAVYTVTVATGAIPGVEPQELTSPITVNTTLVDLGLPIDYIFKGSSLLQVKNNATLTIEPGVTIQFTNKDGGVEIRDGACINAIGTAEKHIQFVGGATKGSWYGVVLKTTTDNVFTYVDFINGGSSPYLTNAVIEINYAQVGISHSTVSGGLHYGINIYGESRITAFDNNTVSGFTDKAPVYMNGQLKMLEKFDMTSDFTNNTNKYIEIACAQSHKEDATLQQTSVPYFFNRSIDYLDSRLTIEAGVTIYMGDDSYIAPSNTTHSGVLNINGTVEKPVKFTRLPGTSYYWRNIAFRPLTGSVIRNCVFEYGGKSNDSGILEITNEADLTLENVVLRNSYNYGVTIDEWHGTYRLIHSNVTFDNNYKGNVLMKGSGTVLPFLP